jgi:hypothetical protein
MSESEDTGGQRERPHVWGFWAAIIVALIGGAATVTVSIQKGHSDDSRRDLEMRAQTLEAAHTKDEARIASLTSDLAAARSGRAQRPATPSSAASSPVPASRTDAADGDPRVRVIKDYIFTLDSCRREDRDVYCWIAVKNTDEDGKLWINSASRLIADDGTPYEQSARIFGRYEDGVLVNFLVQLSAGVPARFGLRFKGLAAKVSHASLVEVVTPDFRIQFHDVPVS